MNSRHFIILIFLPAICFACRDTDGKDGFAGLTLFQTIAVIATTPTPAPTTSPAVKRTFMTAQDKDGALGGTSGADGICASEPSNPDTGAVWKALLTDGVSRIACTTPNCGGGASEHTDWVLATNTTYTNADGSRTLFTSGAVVAIHDFTGGELLSRLGDSGETWWSGLNLDWTSNSNDCMDWSNTVANGVIGDGNAQISNAISSSSLSCIPASRSLLCVEQ